MKEIKLAEVVPRLNTRGVMGRVVILNKAQENASPRVTGTVIMCCNRAYLTKESYDRHKELGLCDKATDGASFRSAGYSSRTTYFSGNDNDVDFESDEEMPFNVGSMVKCELADEPQMNSPTYSGSNRTLNGLRTPTKEQYSSDDSKWTLPGRKISFLEREFDTSPSKLAADVSHFKRIKTESGSFVYSCRKCSFTSYETSKITVHVKTVHSGLLASNRKHPPNGRIKIEQGAIKNEARSENDGQWFTCSLCNVFRTRHKQNLATHEQNAHIPLSNGFPCRFCSCVYATKGRTTSHENIFHAKMLTMKEKPAGTHVDTKHKKGRGRLIIGKRLPCNLCSLTFSSNQNIAKHKRSSHVHGGTFDCPYCPCVFANEVTRNLHKKKYHKENAAPRKILRLSSKDTFLEDWLKQASNSVKDDKAINPTNATGVLANAEGNERVQVPNSKLQHRCAICRKQFTCKAMLILHQRKRHLLNVNLINGLDGVNNVRRRNQCLKCSRAFKSIVELQDHNKSAHVRGGSYPCSVEECKCVFGTLKSLSLHLRWHKNISTKNGVKMETKSVEVKLNHLSGESLTCELCGLKMKNETEVNLHLKTSHVICGVQCECGCSFGTATELTQHKLRECPKLISSSEGPTKYRRSPTTCTCGLKFQSRHELLDHMEEKSCKPNDSKEVSKVEVPESSDTSSEITLSEVDFVPKKEPSISCPHCNLKFQRSVGLRIHVLYMHTKKLPSASFSKCEICDYNTQNFRTYTRHKKTCHVKDGYQCPECCCTFKTVDGVGRHFTLMHKNKTLDRTIYELKCNECEFTTFSKQDLKWHQQRDHMEKIEKEDIVYSCELCNYRTRSSASELKRHMETCHVENGFKCKYCCCSMLTEAGLRFHLSKWHSKEYENGKKSYDCEQCEYSTSNHKNYLDHLKINHVENGFQCEVCPCSFASELGLQRHAFQMHTKPNEDYSSCKLCGYQTSNCKNYKHHMKRCHVENGVQCPDCPCTFKDGPPMFHHVALRHKRKIDLKEYEKKCSICNFVTFLPATLKQHTDAHAKSASAGKGSNPEETTKEYPVCDLCGYKVTTWDLEKHRLRCHVEGGQSCPQCPCSFRNETSLAHHLRGRHSIKMEKSVKDLDPSIFAFPCTRCQFRSKSQQGLNAHSILMHGVKIPFIKKHKVGRRIVCSICNMSYSGTTAAHKRVYHVENGFKCAHCPCTFETYSSRLRHLIKVHKNFGSKRCNLCGLRFTGTVEKHTEKCHVKDGIKCSHCCCTFTSEHSKRAHEVHVHKGFKGLSSRNGKSNQCNLCGIRCKESLSKHLKRCHVKGGLRCSYCVCTFVSEASRLIHIGRQHDKSLSGSGECKLCLGTFKNLRCHTKKCHIPGGIKCDFCSCTLATETGKVFHTYQKHKDKMPTGPKVCHLCNLEVNSMPDHLKRSHVPGGIKCDYCSCSFANLKGKITHIQLKHKEETPVAPVTLRANVCELCGNKVTWMQEHLKKCHVPKGVKCDHCSCTLSNKRSKRIHMFKIHREKMPLTSNVCQLCGIKVTNLKEHLKYNHIKNGIPCSYCSCTLRSEESKLKHTRKYHEGKKPVVKNCDLCGMRLHGTLAEHMRSHHGSSGYQCSYCNCKLRTQDERRIHIFKMHRDTSQLESSREIYSNPNNTCKLCGIETNERLEDHIRRCHCVSNPFTCSHCTCRFLTKIGLTRHFLNQHKDAIKKQPEPSKSPQKNPSKDTNANKISPSKNDTGVKIQSPQKNGLRKLSPSTADATTTFQCTKCPSKFPSEKALRIHNKLSHSMRIANDSDCASEVSSSGSISSSRSLPSYNPASMGPSDKNKKESHQPSKNQLTCLQCGYVASCLSLLNIHAQKSHVKNSLYPCPRCSCAFANETERERHLKVFHPVPIFIVKELSRTYK